MQKLPITETKVKDKYFTSNNTTFLGISTNNNNTNDSHFLNTLYVVGSEQNILQVSSHLISMVQFNTGATKC